MAVTAKEFLNQAYRLNELIDSDVEELERLLNLATRISVPNFGERVQTSRNPDPPFVRYLDDIVDMEQKITESLEKVENREERLLLTYRYLDNRTWEQIASMLSVSDRTVHRIHASALRNFSVPD